MTYENLNLDNQIKVGEKGRIGVFRPNKILNQEEKAAFAAAVKNEPKQVNKRELIAIQT